MGGDASLTGAELFEIEADFSAKIVTFRLVGGMHPPHPPLNPPLGSRPRPKTQKKSEAKAKDSLSEDRPSRGQGQECSRPRTKGTAASVLQKKRSSKKFFRQSPIYRRSHIFYWGGLNHKSRTMASSKICLLALNQDFAKGEGLN